MLPNTIFLDLDDVLNDFTMPALYAVGCSVNPGSFRNYNPIWGFDILKAANALHPAVIFDAPKFWSLLDYEFWATLPRSTESDSLLERCEALVGREGICVLSNPVQEWNPYVAAAKMEWIDCYLPEWLHNQFLIGPPKHLCARPNALLIDDSDKNVEKFRAFGGQAILMPRPWNSLHYMSPETHLHDTFTTYFHMQNGVIN